MVIRAQRPCGALFVGALQRTETLTIERQPFGSLATASLNVEAVIHCACGVEPERVRKVMRNCVDMVSPSLDEKMSVFRINTLRRTLANFAHHVLH